MKVKHIIISNLLIALSLCYFIGCSPIPRDDWKCRHYVAEYGEQYYKQGKKIDIVMGVCRGERIVDNIYRWIKHVKIEGEKKLDTAKGVEFKETKRWKLNQGYPKDEQNFEKFVRVVRGEE